LESQTAQILRRQLAQALALPQLVVNGSFVSTAERSLRLRDHSAIDSLVHLMQRHPRLHIELIAGVGSRQAEFDSIAALLRSAAGPDSGRVTRTASATRRGIAGRLLLH
jgi:hypothetical protein